MCACRIRGRGLRVYVSFKHASLSLSGRAWLVHNCDSNLARHYHPSLLLSAMTLVKLVSLVSLTWVHTIAILQRISRFDSSTGKQLFMFYISVAYFDG